MTTLPTAGFPAPAPTAGVRLFYMDDSGAHETGWVVYSWIETTVPGWHTGLRAWLDLRKELYADYGIPPSKELHATKFISGRGNPSTSPGVNLSKAQRSEVAEKALAAIGACPELAVGTVYRQTAPRRHGYGTQRKQVYGELVSLLDGRLRAAGEYAMVHMDGNGTENGYYEVHRGLKLEDRRIIEDPLFMAAHRSQWVQMADFAAWSAYQGLQRHQGKQFAWSWYDDHLTGCDVNGGPLEV